MVCIAFDFGSGHDSYKQRALGKVKRIRSKCGCVVYNVDGPLKIGPRVNYFFLPEDLKTYWRLSKANDRFNVSQCQYHSMLIILTWQLMLLMQDFYSLRL